MNLYSVEYPICFQKKRSCNSDIQILSFIPCLIKHHMKKTSLYSGSLGLISSKSNDKILLIANRFFILEWSLHLPKLKFKQI